MRIVVVLQNARVGHLSCLPFIKALCRNRNEHEIIIALDGCVTDFVEMVRGAVYDVLPQDNIRLWYSPPQVDALWYKEVAGMIETDFLSSLYPDIVLFSEPFDISVTDSSACYYKCSFLLEGDALSNISTIAGIEKFFFLAHSEEVRRRVMDEFDVEELHVAALPEEDDDSCETQAKSAFQAFMHWHASSACDVPLQNESARRPRLAYVSPLPPERSGISDYSAELLPELLRYYDIDVVVEQMEVSSQWIIDNCPIRTSSWLRKHAKDYDRVVYHIGNSPFHLHMFTLLHEVPGVVFLHDFFLSDILEHLDTANLAPGDLSSGIFFLDLYRSHGYSALSRLFASTTMPGEVAAAYPCNFDVLESATGVIVHSEYAKVLYNTWYPRLDSNSCTYIPLLRSLAHTLDRTEARCALGLGNNDLVVCSFGMPGLHKLSDLLLEAWFASSLAENTSCILLFVGEISGSDFNRNMQESIQHHKFGSRIRMTGWVPMEQYRLYLAAADIGVQLRTMSRGESSAAALDCLNYGLATVVNANGSLAELPEDCVLMLSDKVRVDELKETLEILHSNTSLRKQLGENGRAYVRNERNPSRIASLYAAAIEHFSLNSNNIRSHLLQKLSLIKDMPDGESDLFAIAEAVSGTFPNHCGQKQLLIDVSALIVEDLKTGIQRVVRSIVKELLEEPPNGFRIEPVFMELGEHGVFFRYARQFTLSFLNIDNECSSFLGDEPIEVHPGDIFLGLDLCHNVRYGQQFFDEFRCSGGLVYFVVYDLLPLFFPNFFPPEVEKHHSDWMDVVSQGDGVLCISQSVADDVKVWFDSVQPNRHRRFSIGWFHLGADIEQSIPTMGLPEGFECDLQKLGSAPTLIMVGTVEPRKGHDQVLKAVELLWMIGVAVNLVIVGKKGWMVDQLAKQIAEHKKLGNSLFWYENVSDEALQKLYTLADGMLMASEGEGFGLPLIEAAQHGCPILSRDLPVFREVAGDHATYFKGKSRLTLASSLRQWITDIKNGTVISSKGIPWLTWKESASQVVALLTDATNSQWVHQWDIRSKSLTPHHPWLPQERVALPKIAVDLTPVLPGGENGGAKVFVLELLRVLGDLKPDTEFILLTRESSHKELAFLDGPNMRRVIVLFEEPVRDSTAKPLRKLTLWAERTVWRWKRSIRKRLNTPAHGPKRVLHEMGIDLLFCPFTSLHNAESGIPTVCTVYDLQYKTYPEFFTDDEVVHRDKVFIETCRRATAIATISDYSRESVIAHGNIDPSVVRRIYLRMARRISTHNVPDDTYLNHLGLTPKKYLLYPANFWKHKNHETLLTAFVMACHEGLEADIKLVCTGAPCERQQLLIDKTRSMGFSHRVIFPGYLPNEELALLLSNAVGMIFPSLYEGFGLPVIEAMAAGVPVACSNTRSLPEVTAGAALLFDPTVPEQIAWAMLFLAGKDSHLIELINAGLKQATEFSDKERMAQEYWLLFEDAMASERSYVLEDDVRDTTHLNNEQSNVTNSALKVSVITPSFNQGQFIERTLLSVANQGWPFVEHVVFDGGSSDNTIDVLKKYSPMLRWVSEADKGQTHAVNKGILETDGEIIGWLNSDDIYYPDALARVVSFFEANPDVDVVYGRADHIDVHDRPFEAYPTEQWNIERLYDTCFICQPAVFFRRTVINQHGLLDESLHYCMDYEYWLRLAKAGVRFGFLDKKLAGSRLYADNKTLGSKVKVHREINDMFRNRFGNVPKRWLQNYAHVTMHDRWGGLFASQTEFNIRYYFAKSRWKLLS